MDTAEVCGTIKEFIDNDKTNTDVLIRAKEGEKLDREIEKLKVETEFKVQLEKMNIVESNIERGMQQIKLPRLTLNKFNGDLTEWTSFWDSFQSTIHLNNQLSKVDKFKYLISCLQGEAKDTLAEFHLTLVG